MDVFLRRGAWKEPLSPPVLPFLKGPRGGHQPGPPHSDHMKGRGIPAVKTLCVPQGPPSHRPPPPSLFSHSRLMYSLFPRRLICPVKLLYFIVVFLSTRGHISEKRGVAWGWGQSVKLKKLQKKKREVQAWEGIEAATGKVQKRRKQKKALDLLLKPEGLWAGLRV